MLTAVHKDLVLVGGGHSHIAVLKAFGMRRLPGARLTLISRNTETPYSGMLPGLIAGRYSFDEAHIDLEPLTRFAGARFFRDEVVGLDLNRRRIELADRPPVAFDLLSINSGSTPSTRALTSDSAAVVPVKPIDRFLERWDAVLTRSRRRGRPTRFVVVGGGVGGVELALAAEARLRSEHIEAAIRILTADADLLSTHNARVRAMLGRILAERGIAVDVGEKVVEVEPGRLCTATGCSFDFDEVLWVTQASAPAWIAASGLATDDGGFLLVDAFLRSTSHANVFAAGDVAAMRASPRPKAGVFAVRQGPRLARNLRRALLGRPLKAYSPQRRFLSLIGTADGAAVASRGALAFRGRWVWAWKDRIDRRFMRRYQALPEMSPESPQAPPRVPRALVADDDAGAATTGDAMRCGGCGAKVGAAVLDAALAGLTTAPRTDVVIGLASPDDAALLSVGGDRLLAVSVDAFRPMIDDPYLFGQIAANHCLNDLYAMAAEPQSALTIAALPVWPEPKLVDELRQMLAGAARVFTREGVALVGGHTSEGLELSLGFCVTGLVEHGASLGKTGLSPGDRLILTKSVGTGVVLAADMRGKARGGWVDAAVRSMCLSNAAAGAIFRAHAAHACTDVTGFGLFGHLLEMAGPSGAEIALDLGALPLLPGALDLLHAGIASTMQPKNEQARARADCEAALAGHECFPLLFDPQTAGGLIAAVPAADTGACLTALAAAGYRSSAVVGSVERCEPGRRVGLRLRHR